MTATHAETIELNEFTIAILIYLYRHRYEYYKLFILKCKTQNMLNFNRFPHLI
jgi:hypothetical protein